MARYDVFPNPESDERELTPYLLDVQNDYISGLGSRVVIPLRAEEAFGRPARGLNPVFLVEQTRGGARHRGDGRDSRAAAAQTRGQPARPGGRRDHGTRHAFWRFLT